MCAMAMVGGDLSAACAANREARSVQMCCRSSSLARRLVLLYRCVCVCFSTRVCLFFVCYVCVVFFFGDKHMVHVCIERRVTFRRALVCSLSHSASGLLPRIHVFLPFLAVFGVPRCSRSKTRKTWPMCLRRGREDECDRVERFHSARVLVQLYVIP